MGYKVVAREETMKIVYLCHPNDGQTAENLNQLRRICREMKHEAVFVMPGLILPQYLDPVAERELALKHRLALVILADEMWVLAGNLTTEMWDEIVEARKLGILVRPFKPTPVLLKRTQDSQTTQPQGNRPARNR